MKKPIVWFAGEVRSPPFSAAARQAVGMLLRRLQNGERLSLPESRPVPSVGARVHELRVKDTPMRKNWRVVYRINRDAIVVVDVFAKTSRRLRHHRAAACRRRLRRYDATCQVDRS